MIRQKKRQTCSNSEKLSQIEALYVRDSYYLGTSGFCTNLLISVLIGVMASVFPLLLNSNHTIFYTSLPLYFSIVMLFGFVLLMRWWSVVASIITFVLCGLLQEFPLRVFVVNTGANILQVVILLLAAELLRRKWLGVENPNWYPKGIFHLSLYNVMLITIFISYIAYYIIHDSKLTVFEIAVFAALLLLCTIGKSILQKDPYLLLYTFLIAFLPSLIASTFSAFGTPVPKAERVVYVLQWTFSNYILLQTFGYILYQLLYHKKFTFFKNDVWMPLTYSTTTYYFAIILLNFLILFVIKEHIRESDRFVFFFPWLFGNIFLGMNLFFSTIPDANGIEDSEKRFGWYEHRVVVVEKNMSFIITIIAFLLPAGFSAMRQVSELAEIIFIANIFCACITLGLVWIPCSKIKFINLLKCLKTTFYLYSITLLLISSIMIIMQIANDK